MLSRWLLVLTVVPTLVWGDAATEWENCYDVPIPGNPLRPCIHFGVDTCGDIGLHGWFNLGNRNTSFDITNPSSLDVCISLSNPVCNRFCLRLGQSTFRLTHSYASFTPYIAISGPLCPISQFPGNPTTYSLGVDCDGRSNTTCDSCTAMSDQGTCAWCPSTGACVATSGLSTSLCDGMNMCPDMDVLHPGMCPTPDPSNPTPTPTPTPTPIPTPTPTPTDACSNPMFMGTLQVTRSRLHLLTAPRVLNGASCPNLSGKVHCCDYDTFDQWKHMMNSFDQAAIVAAGDHGDLKLDDLLRMLNNVTLLPKFSNPTQDELVQLNKLLDIFKILDQPIQKCAKAVVAYWNGLMCFACHADWRTYYNPDTQLLRLNISTCDAASDGCAPVLELLNANRKNIMQIMVALYTLSGDTTYNDIKAAMQIAINLDGLLPHMCQIGWLPSKTCREVVCDRFLHGLDYNFTLPTLRRPLVDAHPSHTLSSSSSSLSSHVDPFSWLIPSLTSSHPITHVHVLGFIMTWVQHMDITTKGHVQHVYAEPTGGHAINQYVVDGYPVNQVGCAAQMSKQACISTSPTQSPTQTPPTQTPTRPSQDQTDTSQAKSNMGLIIGVVVGVALLVVALVGLVCFIRKRRTRVPPHRRLQDQDELGEVATSPNGSAYSRFDPRL